MILNLPPYPKHEAPHWKGMTLDEIRMRRVLIRARMDISKFKLNAQVENLRRNTPLLNISNGKSMFSRVASAFTFTEYALLAVKLFRSIASLRKK